MADISVVTPEEYINENATALKSDLKRYDIQINKLGVIGHFLNIMGHTQFDVHQYYNHLFKEGFVATAQSDNNLYMHSSIYNYNPGLAFPSQAVGNFIFDFSYMPQLGTTIKKREIIYTNLVFSIDGIKFRTDATYKFVQQDEVFYAMIIQADNTVQYIPSASSRIEAPFVDVMQYTTRTISGLTGNYNFASYYPYLLNLESGFLAGIEVSIEDENNIGDYITYEIKNTKYLEDAFSNVVFFRPTGIRSFLLEFGSGIRGNYIPNTKFKLKLYETTGKTGNLNVTSKLNLTSILQNHDIPSSFDFGVNYNLDTDTLCTAKQISHGNEEVTYISENVKDILQIQFNYSADGQDQIAGADLRKNIVNYIQSRNNLLSEKDYYNITYKYFEDFKFLFKKTTFLDNTFYLHRCFRNKYQVPTYSTTHSHKLMLSYNTSPTVTASPLNTTTGNLSPGTYTYYIRATDGFGETLKSNIINITITETYRAIQLSWTAIPDASYYIVYGRPDDGIYQYWEVEGLQFIDNGQSGQPSRPFDTTSPLVFYPKFKVNNENFLSPFIYKYNSYFQWFEGSLLYTNMIINMNVKTELNSATFDFPVFYFNIVYNFNLRTTYIYVKSHQDISGYEVVADIPELNIVDYALVNVDDNTFVYEYMNDDYGLLSSAITINVDITKLVGDDPIVLRCSGTSGPVMQVVNVKDQLKLFTYKDIDNRMFVTNIPVIHSAQYNNDPTYYRDKLYDFIFTNKLQEHRMVADEIQFRFLNNFVIDQFYLNHLLLQTYETSLKLPLNLKVECYIDELYLESNDVDLNAEKDSLIAVLADLLQTQYSGVSIRYYNSQIIDVVHTDRPYIKSVSVTVTDQMNTGFANGFEMLTDKQILDNIQMDVREEELSWNPKLNIIKYCPPLWWWDVNAISVKFLYNR